MFWMFLGWMGMGIWEFAFKGSVSAVGSRGWG